MTELKDRHIYNVLLCALSIPLLSLPWTIDVINKKFLTKNEGIEALLTISPGRLLMATIIPLLLAVPGYRKKSLALSGALGGIFISVIFTLTNYSFMACLGIFFVTASQATKVRAHIKRKLEADFKAGGQRRWVQALCNGGMATQFALLYLFDVGPSERPIDFVKDYKAAYLTIGVLATLAASNGDTWASELGPVFIYSDPYLITTFKKVPKQTNGGVSPAGTLFSALGGLTVGTAQYLALYYFSDYELWWNAPPQWPILLVGAFSGFFGSLIDSLFGATLQYSGLNKEGQVVLDPCLAVQHITGRNILDNNCVNLISINIVGLLVPTLCFNIWPLLSCY